VKTLLTLVAAAVALAAVVWCVGLAIPRGHVAARSAHFRSSPQQVWAMLSNLPGYEHWAPEVTGVKRLADNDGHPVYALEGKWAMPLEVESTEAPRRMVTRIADPKLPFGGTWTWELRPEGQGTRVVVTERGEIKPAMMRTMARFIFGYTSTIDTYLKALGDGLQETVVPGPVGT